MRNATLTAVLAIATVTACASVASTWRPLPAEQMSPAQQQQRQRMLDARDQLFTALSGKLMTALQEGGPANAIGVCREQAPAVAADVAQRLSLRIGRTSDRLRNGDNQPPAWAVEPLRQRPAAPIYLAGSGGELGALLPIKLATPCLACHGPIERIDADVMAKLREYYPDDRATGYAEGDLRGWFWVEVK